MRPSSRRMAGTRYEPVSIAIRLTVSKLAGSKFPRETRTTAVGGRGFVIATSSTDAWHLDRTMMQPGSGRRACDHPAAAGEVHEPVGLAQRRVAEDHLHRDLDGRVDAREVDRGNAVRRKCSPADDGA